MTEISEIPPGAEVTSASEWKQAVAPPVPLVVPSGHTCLARSPGMRHFLKAGMVPDSLLPIIYKAMKTGTSPDLKKLEDDGEKINDMVQLMDNVIVSVVVQPRVLPLPKEEDPESDKYDPDFERDDDFLYVDEVDPEDKVFIFQWACGGTSDLEEFRRSADELVDPAPGRKNVQRPAKRSGGTAKRKR